jgi:hypothetical protein
MIRIGDKAAVDPEAGFPQAGHSRCKRNLRTPFEPSIPLSNPPASSAAPLELELLDRDTLGSRRVRCLDSAKLVRSRPQDRDAPALELGGGGALAVR